MKVLYVIDSLRAGGAEQSLAAMCEPLRQRGVEIVVATFSEGGEHADEVLRAGAEIRTIDGGGLIARARFVQEVAKSGAADLIHTTLYDADLAGRLASRLARLPVSSTLTTTRYVEGWAPMVPRWKTLPVHIAEALSSRLCRRLHAVSETVADVMSAKLRYPRSRIDVVPRGRDPDHLGRRTPERSFAARGVLGVASGAPMLLSVGRRDSVKGHDVAIRALPALAREHPDVALVVAGRSGDATDELAALADELGVALHVRFVGHRDDIGDLMCAADVLLSGSRREGMPGTIIESLALELPIVATDLPQIREVVGGNARLIAVDDASAMSDAALDVLQLPEAAQNDAQNGRSRFEDHFTMSVAVDGLIEHWRRVLD